jgi:hypothetical protein
MALQRTPRPRFLKVQSGFCAGAPVQELAGTGRSLRSLGAPLNAQPLDAGGRSRRRIAPQATIRHDPGCLLTQNSYSARRFRSGDSRGGRTAQLQFFPGQPAVHVGQLEAFSFLGGGSGPPRHMVTIRGENAPSAAPASSSARV